MNQVEKVKELCKERKISLHKLEMDCGFSNGYIGQLKKGYFPPDRLQAISDYFKVNTDYFILGDFNDKLTPEQKEQDEIMTMISKIKPDKYAEIKRFLKYKMLEDDL